MGFSAKGYPASPARTCNGSGRGTIEAGRGEDGMDGPQLKMLSGFNHNIRYRGKVYHVQTEDGGKGNPQIITHAFQGGEILDSVRTSYTDLLGRPNWQAELKYRMNVLDLEDIRSLVVGYIVPPEGDPGER